MSDILQIENGVLISCTDKSATSVTIPDGVTQIGENAFKDCTSLSSVLIPESVTEIGRFAFHNCAALSSLSIPTSVTKIGNYAFLSCKAISLSGNCLAAVDCVVSLTRDSLTVKSAPLRCAS